MLLCRRVVEDTFTHENILISPIHEFAAPQYPVIIELSLFAKWTSVQGSYRIECQLQDMEGDVVWREKQDVPLENPNPLLICVLRLFHLRLYFPKPGKYDFVLLA